MRTRARLLKVCWMAFVFAGLWSLQQSSLLAADKQDKRVLEQARRYHNKGRYPKDLPQGVAPPRRRSGCDKGPSRRGPSLFGAGCVRVAPWIFLGIVLVLLLTVIVSVLRRAGDWISDKTEVQEAEAVAEVLGRKMQRHMRLEDFLSQSDWEGAICFVLLQAMRLTGWRPEGKGASQTAREVIHKVPSHQPQAKPLYRLLRLAESVRFGGVHADQALFEQAQQALDEFRTLQPAPPPTNATEAMPSPS